MKICLAQYDICWENKKENMDICEQVFESAAENRADLIVFPELSLTGFSMDMSLAESSDGDTSAFFSECAERYGAACVFGYAERIG
ncbi:MAG: carbon-nitrogen family hydrolase, partial [Oscillospiraceae bacterium]|nr:carbon-nitrogen family hydrolase [Oscillospiraceae bacterium]